MLPVAHHTHALEALALDVDIVVGELMAGGAEVRHAHGLVVQLVLLDDGGLDGHAMVIPAGNIGGVVAAHGVHAVDEVLQGLVQSVAHMQRAVGERRAVVQGEQGLALVLLQQLVVEVDLLPVLQHVRLALGQAGTHGKAALGHVQGLFVFHVASPFIRNFLLKQNKKRLCLVKRQRRVKASSAVPLLLPRKAATQSHQPWVRGDNGPLPSALTGQRPSGGCSGVIPQTGCPSALHQTAALFARQGGGARLLHRSCTVFP